MKNILYIGDLHGNFAFIKWYLKAHKIKNHSLIQVGDFGVGFKPTTEDYVLKDLNDELGERECTLLVIRGNHDNPSYFDGNHDYEHIKFMPDYSTMFIDDLNHLFIGGAVSIDRTLRKSNIDYWEDEKFNFDLERVKSLTNIDVVVTHTAPNFVPPLYYGGIVSHYCNKDSSLYGDLESEKNAVTEIFKELKKNNQLKYHFYGHFHDNSKEIVDGCNHIMLNISDVYNPYLYE